MSENCPTCGGPKKRQYFKDKGLVESDNSDAPAYDPDADPVGDASGAPPAPPPPDVPDATAAPADAAPAPAPDQAQPDSAAQPAPAAAGVADSAAPTDQGQVPYQVPGAVKPVGFDPNAAPPPLTPAEQEQQLNADDQGLQADITQGKINPKQFPSLFDDRSIPAKLGTLFGLLVSGAGSGLAHQSNAAMDVIQKELDRDLQGQIQSAHNKQNWYTLGMQRNLQNAQLPGIAANSAMTAMRTAWAYGTLPDLVSMYPAGSPQRANAEQVMGQVQKLVGVKNAADNKTAVGKTVLQQALQGRDKYAPARSDGQPIDPDRLQALTTAGTGSAISGMPQQTGKFISPADWDQIMNNEKPAVEQGRIKLKAAMDATNVLNNLPNAGQTASLGGKALQVGASFMPGAGGAAAKEIGNTLHGFEPTRQTVLQSMVSQGWTRDEAENFLPAGVDDAKSRGQKLQELMDVTRNKERILAPKAFHYGLLTDFPGTNTQQKRRAP